MRKSVFLRSGTEEHNVGEMQRHNVKTELNDHPNTPHSILHCNRFVEIK